MAQENMLTVKEQRMKEVLEAGLATADCYISRSYLIDLPGRTVLPVNEDIYDDTSLRFYHIERFVYDKNENVNDKMISVYDALHELGGTAILLISGDETGVEFHLGASSRSKAALCGDLLEKGIKGNFPGSSVKRLKTSAVSSLLDSTVKDKRNVSAVSIVPSMRDEDKDKFVQGIEKFIDTMQGERYTAIFVAEPISKTDLEYRKRGLEELASSLSPFVKTTLAYGENFSDAVTEGMTENFSRSVNQSVANTYGHNSSTNQSVTHGSNTGFNVGGASSGKNKSKTSGYSSGSSWSKAVTEGSSDTTGTSTNKSSTITKGDNRTLTIEHINKSAENLMKTVDMQLERIRDCEAFGLWDCAAYFFSDEIHISVMAANTYKALVAGDSSSVENSYVNVWDSSNENTQSVVSYLRHGLHPKILITQGVDNGFDRQTVTPGSFISGKELPLFMGIPQKSVSGLTVSAIAEFGRGVFTVDTSKPKGDLPLGYIFHMGQEENIPVHLDVDSFTSHCFISGSTGSGKSNTTYLLLNEFYKRNIPFLVVEPAKGEYKSEFANLPGVHIYSTNPRYGRLLRLNPFRFDSDEVHVLEHLDRLIEIFNACWEMYAAMPAILKSAAEQIYIQNGWDILNSVYIGEGKPKFPTFTDLLRVLPEIVKSSSYSADTQGDYTGALVTRVASLANGITGQIFCSGFDIPDEVLFDENVIIDLSRVGSSETKALIMGILVMKLTEYRTAKATGSNSKLKHITVLEEAHNLLKRTNTSQGQDSANVIGKSVEMISSSIAEMRTYGEGFIIVDQSPTAVDVSAIKNTNTKIIMRLPEKTDCEAIGNAMALDEEQIKELAKLPTGVAAVMQNNWLETALVKVRYAPSDYRGECPKTDNNTLRKLRGVAVEQIINQYWRDRRFNEEAIKEELQKVNAPSDKTEEIFEQVVSMIREVGNDRNVECVIKNMLDISCCRNVFEIHEQMLNQVDFAAGMSEMQKLNDWRNNLERSFAATLDVSDSRIGFFTRCMIHAYTLTENSNKYFTAYRMLYEGYSAEKQEPQENQDLQTPEKTDKMM